MNDVNTDGIEVPGYRLVRAIGSGGVASVYVAMQRSLERQVAVKVFDALDQASLARFEQLLRTNARLSHPNIVGIHQIGHTDGGLLFNSMPFLPSAALSRHNLRLKPLKVAAVMRALLEALGYAHRRGIVHGGIKPSNVLFDPNGRTRLGDFGIARCAAELGMMHPNAAAYLSPEQARGNPPGRRSDLYSIGVLAWEFLTGTLPFEGEDAIATAIAHIEQPVPRLPPVAGAWQAWIDKALAKSPEDRFQSAAEMADALSAIDGQPGNGHVARTATRMRLPKWTLAAAASIAVLVAALAGWTIWSGHQAPNARDDTATTLVQANTASANAIAIPDPATPVAASSVSPLEGRIQVLIAQAKVLRAGGHLFSPPGNNAVEQYLTVLMLDPGNLAARKGVDAMLATMRHRLDQAWRGRQPTQVLDLVKKCDLLAGHASHAIRRDWSIGRADLAREVGAAVVATARNRDERQFATLKPLAEALPATFPAGIDLATAERMAATPNAGARVQDHGGPLLVYLPVSGKAPAFAIARVEVTGADYAAFARATKRPASRCLEAHNPFSRMRRLTWQSPGFAQGSDYPVVCVSWNDAVAYAAWLSKTTGETYRLPDDSEWLRAAQGMPKESPCQLGNVDDVSRNSVLDNDRLSCDDHAAQTAPVGHYAPSGIGAYDMYGNVSEWLAGGSASERVFRGLSWRDGSRQTPLGSRGTADTDVGYTNVGFRVMRVIDAAHPAPSRVDSGN